jgi:TolB-like protein
MGGIAVGDRSLAVLSHVTAGNDERERYFADGVTREIIVALSRFAELKVVVDLSAGGHRPRPRLP